jgi:hypothetical protein
MNERREERGYVGVPFLILREAKRPLQSSFFGLLNLKRTAARTTTQVKRRSMGG